MIFRNKYWFLSNMYPCDITLSIKDVTYTFSCVEAAFQAHKNSSQANKFVNIDGFTAKKLGRKINLLDDWNDVSHWNNERTNIMRNILTQKFTQHPELTKKLIAIDEPIVEENTWGDTFWGVCNGKGENQLGKLLTEIKEKECFKKKQQQFTTASESNTVVNKQCEEKQLWGL